MTRVCLIDVASMPRPGLYHYFRLDEKAFVQAVKKAHRENRLWAYLRKEEIAHYLFDSTGILFGASETPLELHSLDTLLVCYLQEDQSWHYGRVTYVAWPEEEE